MDRLDIMHGMIYKALDDKLHLAPLDADKIHRALDLGTGTGICKFLFDNGRWLWVPTATNQWFQGPSTSQTSS